jgi:hypothetical protein
MQYNQDGTDKRTMETDRAHNCYINPNKRPERPKTKGSSRSHDRDVMDFTNRRIMEGFAAKVSTIPNMPQAVPAMGEKGTFRLLAQELTQDLYERGGIDIREALIDGTFVPGCIQLYSNYVDNEILLIPPVFMPTLSNRNSVIIF